MPKVLKIISELDLNPFMGVDFGRDNDIPDEILDDEELVRRDPRSLLRDNFHLLLSKQIAKNIDYSPDGDTIVLPKTAKSIEEYINYIDRIIKLIEKQGYTWWMASQFFIGPESGQKGIIHPNPKDELITVVYDNPDNHKLTREKYYVGSSKKLL